jgi:hypothetical protein
MEQLGDERAVRMGKEETSVSPRFEDDATNVFPGLDRGEGGTTNVFARPRTRR